MGEDPGERLTSDTGEEKRTDEGHDQNGGRESIVRYEISTRSVEKRRLEAVLSEGKLEG